MTEFDKPDMLVRTKRVWVLLAGIGLVAASIAVSSVRNSAPITAMNLIGAALTLAFHRWRRERRGRVRADERGLWMDGSCIATRESIRAADVHRRAGLTYVRLARRLVPVDVVVADDDEADALIGSLRLGTATTVARYTMSSGPASSVVPGVLVSLLSVVPLVALQLAYGLPRWSVWSGGALSIAAVLLVLFRKQVRLSVGTDGIHFRRWLGPSRFVPLAEIRSAETRGAEVVLQLRDGSAISVHSGADGRGADDLQHAKDGLVSRITMLLAEEHAGASERYSSSLARGGRSTKDWLRDLSEANETRATYRVSAVPRDALWRLVEDPAALPTTRAGAAVALREMLDDTGRRRLRIAAEACAAPRLRVALDAAADATEAALLEDALDPLEDELEPRHRRAES